MKTIEGDIYEAFAKAGAILQANATDPIKVKCYNVYANVQSSFQRAARTDKGVHAAGNVISLKIMLGDNNDDVVEKVNSFLPPQIRIWGIQRTINAFNSHTHCDSRVYEYIIPSHCFLPPKPGSTSAECSKEFQAQEREPEPEDNFWDSILEGDFFALLKRYNANRKETTSDLPDLSAEELDRFNKMRETETEAIRAFRLSPQRLERIRSAVKVYLGTHNFHNLTVGVPFNSSHAQRYMMSIDVAEPKLIGSTEWIRIRIHGQSFMLHQIRKMIGAVLLAIRYGVGEESIRQTLRTRENMHIPKAPAQGLLLERPVFSGMKEKLQKFDHEPLEWGPYEEKIEKFKDDFIYKSIFREVTSENMYFILVYWTNGSFHEFINFMDSFKYEQGKGLAMFVQDRQTNELAEKFEKEDEGNVKGDNENLEG
jgi:tRNA pseudouridine38-40 synthase